MTFQHPRTSRFLSAVLTIFALAGCSSVALKPLTESEILARGQADREAAQAGVEPLAGTLTLEGAIARALKYNLGARTRMMEEALAMHQYDVSRYDMLPKLVASAGYSTRNNDQTVRSIDSVTGAASLANPSISSDRSHTLSELGLTWSILDFGLSHAVATQNADRVLIAIERRRKAMHVLIQDVRTTYWRAISAQRLKGQVQKAIAQADEALEASRKAERERLRSPLDSLRYQKQLLENLRLLEAINHELSSAGIELAALVNLPLGFELQVAEPDYTLDDAVLMQPVDRLEEMAITRNADIREQHYNVRIAGEETRKAVLRMFPNLGLNISTRYDDNSYLVNHGWHEAGLQLSWNLFNFLSGPAQLSMAEAGIAVADQRRIATQMAVLAQMHVARLQYANAISQYDRAEAMWAVDSRISEHVRNQVQAQTQSKLEQISSQTAVILSLLRRYQALSNAHAAASRLQASLGLEPDVASVRDATLQELTQAIKVSLAEWQKLALPAARNSPASAVDQVKDSVNAWLQSWGTASPEKHFTFYADNFIPSNNATSAQWQTQRRKRLPQSEARPSPGGKIAVTAIDDVHVVAEFPRQTNTGRNEGLVVQHWTLKSGQWRIDREALDSGAL
ncbi:MAG: TolC family protein [Rhodocyclaceae bacterium]